MSITIKTSEGLEPFKISLVQEKINKYSEGLKVDSDEVTRQVVSQLVDGMTTKQIDELTVAICEDWQTKHYDYTVLGSRILSNRLSKEVGMTFEESLKANKEFEDSFITDEIIKIVEDNEFTIKLNKQEDTSIFRVKNEYKKYCYRIKKDGKTIYTETPDYRRLRNALGLWGNDIGKVQQTFKRLIANDYTHSGCINRNAGKKEAQLANCVLLAPTDDLKSIYDVTGKIANYASCNAGIGVGLSQLRVSGSNVKGQIGVANGYGIMMDNINTVVKKIRRGNREAAVAVYMDIWHGDVEKFLKGKKQSTVEDDRYTKLHFGLMINNLFMERVEADTTWSLFSPHKCPKLLTTYDKEFEKNYSEYELQGLATKTIKARDLFKQILSALVETGEPYITNRDEINNKNMLKNLGTVDHSNLCNEVILPTAAGHISTCNISNVVLPSCVINGKFDFHKLKDLAYELTENLNQVIDTTYYPTEEGRQANLDLRPIGVGIQGLADVFAMLNLNYDSEEARKLNKDIAETIYYGCLQASCDLAMVHGAYKYFEGSPYSQGILQYDLWEDRKLAFVNGKYEVISSNPVQLSGMWDFEELKNKIKIHGVRNSLVTAYMPTVGSGQILGNNASFEPFAQLISKNEAMGIRALTMNKHICKDLEGLAISRILKEIVDNNGSIQDVNGVPKNIKEKYRNCFEIPMKAQLEMSHDRSPFIDHSQSLNWYLKLDDFAKMNNPAEETEKFLQKLYTLHIIAWKLGLKSCSYYTAFQKKNENVAKGLSCVGGGCE